MCAELTPNAPAPPRFSPSRAVRLPGGPAAGPAALPTPLRRRGGGGQAGAAARPQRGLPPPRRASGESPPRTAPGGGGTDALLLPPPPGDGGARPPCERNGGRGGARPRGGGAGSAGRRAALQALQVRGGGRAATSHAARPPAAPPWEPGGGRGSPPRAAGGAEPGSSAGRETPGHATGEAARLGKGLAPASPLTPPHPTGRGSGGTARPAGNFGRGERAARWGWGWGRRAGGRRGRLWNGFEEPYLGGGAAPVSWSAFACRGRSSVRVLVWVLWFFFNPVWCAAF